MYEIRTTNVSVQFLSWVNHQLREEIRRKQEETRQTQLRFAERRTAFLASLSGFTQSLFLWLHG